MLIFLIKFDDFRCVSCLFWSGHLGLYQNSWEKIQMLNINSSLSNISCIVSVIPQVANLNLIETTNFSEAETAKITSLSNTHIEVNLWGLVEFHQLIWLVVRPVLEQKKEKRYELKTSWPFSVQTKAKKFFRLRVL